MEHHRVTVESKSRQPRPSNDRLVSPWKGLVVSCRTPAAGHLEKKLTRRHGKDRRDEINNRQCEVHRRWFGVFLGELQVHAVRFFSLAFDDEGASKTDTARKGKLCWESLLLNIDQRDILHEDVHETSRAWSRHLPSHSAKFAVRKHH